MGGFAIPTLKRGANNHYAYGAGVGLLPTGALLHRPLGGATHLKAPGSLKEHNSFAPFLIAQTFGCLQLNPNVVLSHPFRKIRGMGGAPKVLYAPELKTL